MSRLRPTSSAPVATIPPASAPWDATTGRLVKRLNDDLVVIAAPRIHRRPQVFVAVKTRRDGWCRITAQPLPKGSDAFAPLRRAAAYCHISGAVVRATPGGERLKSLKT